MMVEIGKILSEMGDKSGNICKKMRKRIFSTSLSNILDTPLMRTAIKTLPLAHPNSPKVLRRQGSRLFLKKKTNF